MQCALEGFLLQKHLGEKTSLIGIRKVRNRSESNRWASFVVVCLELAMEDSGLRQRSKKPIAAIIFLSLSLSPSGMFNEITSYLVVILFGIILRKLDFPASFFGQKKEFMVTGMPVKHENRRIFLFYAAVDRVEFVFRNFEWFSGDKYAHVDTCGKPQPPGVSKGFLGEVAPAGTAGCSWFEWFS